jgi:protein-S-isoprenylcysteine O-methyltransferase Ste14
MIPGDENSQNDHAGVRFPPPLIYLLPLLAGLMFDSPWSAGRLAATGWMVAGAVLFLAGAALLLAGAPKHRRAGTSIEPWKPTTAIIDDGVYGYSRNPLYLAMALVYAGVAVAGGSIAALVLLIPALLVIRYYVIAREEAYLDARFGATYQAYKAKVRRWL